MERLQVKWASHLPYRQAPELLREVLPLDKGISFGSTRRQILAVGNALYAQIERDIASAPKPMAMPMPMPSPLTRIESANRNESTA